MDHRGEGGSIWGAKKGSHNFLTLPKAEVSLSYSWSSLLPIHQANRNISVTSLCWSTSTPVLGAISLKKFLDRNFPCNEAFGPITSWNK